MQKTKTTTQLILLILMGLILFSCNQKKESKSIADENGVREIKVDLKKSKDIDLADFADEVKYIKLETNEESTFSGIYKLEVNSKGIFIWDQYSTNKVLHFSPDGKFLNKIGKVGRGPDEYIQSRDFIVDTVRNTVEIIGNFAFANFTYSFDGEFIERAEYKNIYLNRYYKLNDGNYFVQLGNNLGPDYSTYLFAILSPDFKTVVKEFVPARYPSDFSTTLSISNPIKNAFLFTSGLGDTIYQYRNDSIRAMLTINLGDLSVPIEMRNQEYVDVYRKLINQEGEVAAYNGALNWDQKHVFFDVLYQKTHFLCCYDMQTQKTSIYTNINASKKEVYSRAPRTIHNGNLVFSIDAVDISEQMKKEDTGSTEKKRFGVFSSFEEVQKNTYADDNPILVFMKPKSDL